LKYDKNGEVVSIKYWGAWLMVNNGYLSWPTTVPLFAKTDNILEEKWSHWLESMQKDVECTFGILKGCLRILKSGVHLHGVHSADMIWKTCCTMHNWLLDIDGLSENWENGMPSDWEGTMGQHSADTMQQHATQPVLDNLHNNEQIHNYDMSDIDMMHSQTFDVNDSDLYDNCNEKFQESAETSLDDDGKKFVITRHLKLNNFRARLIEHFTILHAQNKV